MALRQRASPAGPADVRVMDVGRARRGRPKHEKRLDLVSQVIFVFPGDDLVAFQHFGDVGRRLQVLSFPAGQSPSDGL